MRGKSTLAAMAATAALAAGLNVATVSSSGAVTVQEGSTAKSQPADRTKDVKRQKVEKRMQSRPAWVEARPRGKAYSASIRQHQRHALKKRNQAKARKANR